jgi:hypothetical protein
MAVLTVAALLLHLGVLSEVAWTWPQPTSMAHTAAMQFRFVAATTQLAGTPEVRPTSAKHVSAPPKRAAPGSVPVSAAAAVPIVRKAGPPDVQSETEAAHDEPLMQPIQLAANAHEASDATAPTHATDTTATEAAPADEPIPHYRTKLPPAITLRYDLQRGVLHGNGDLTWQPRGDQYEIKLEGKVGGLAVLTQTSSGGFDANGIAPQRFLDQRFRRPTAAANFQRVPGKITFSGPSTEYPLRPGSQDRLSWMVQLAAIVAAEPRLRSPGSKIAMNVASAQGDAGVWVFRCVGPEAIDLGTMTLDTIKFVREPREPHDTDVQVWLDPQRYQLPVQARQQSGPSDEPFELRLRETVPAN